MGQRKPIDRGQTINPTVPANGRDELAKGAFRPRELFDREADLQTRCNATLEKLDRLGERLEELDKRVRRNGRGIQKVLGDVEDRREVLRKSADAEWRADHCTVQALEALDENNPVAFEAALGRLLDLPIAADELNPRIAQLRRAAIARNPKFLDIINRRTGA